MIASTVKNLPAQSHHPHVIVICTSYIFIYILHRFCRNGIINCLSNHIVRNLTSTKETRMKFLAPTYLLNKLTCMCELRDVRVWLFGCYRKKSLYWSIIQIQCRYRYNIYEKNIMIFCWSTVIVRAMT